MIIDRLPQELTHYEAVYSFFEGTVASIILDEIATTRDHALRDNLLEQGCVDFRSSPEPRVERELAKARENLKVDFPVELLWDDTGTGLARAVPSSSSQTHSYIAIAGTVRSLSDAALRFVLAHELAHIGYHHAKLRWIMQTVYPDSNRIPPYLANEYDAWLRCAELSADRAAFCALRPAPLESLSSPIGAVAEVMARLPGSADPGAEARLRCLEDPDAIPEVYRSFLKRPADSYAGQLARFLIAAGDLLAQVDGEYLSSERSYLLNRVSRHVHAGSLEARGDLNDDPWSRVDLSGSQLQREYPDRVHEAFLNLAILVVRDGRVTREEYESLSRIGTSVLKLAPEAMRALLLRVFRSDYYQPFQE